MLKLLNKPKSKCWSRNRERKPLQKCLQAFSTSWKDLQRPYGYPFLVIQCILLAMATNWRWLWLRKVCCTAAKEPLNWAKTLIATKIINVFKFYSQTGSSYILYMCKTLSDHQVEHSCIYLFSQDPSWIPKISGVLLRLVSMSSF